MIIKSVKLLLLLCLAQYLTAELTLPSIFSDHMVLQRAHALPIWGKADPGAIVAVSFAEQSKQTQADSDGKWRVDLTPLQASSTSRTLTVSAQLDSNQTIIEFTDVLVGEVWLCSGQSNMEWSMTKSKNHTDAIAAANHPEIRLYHTPKRPSDRPIETVDAQWKICTPSSVASFSAVAYYFGKKLQQELDVPIGLLQSAWGGTRIEPWTPPSGFEGIDSLNEIHQKVQKTLPSSQYYKKAMGDYLSRIQDWTVEAQIAGQTNSYVTAAPKFPTDLILSGNQQTPTKLYNGMIHAHIPYTIRGAIWYQGESNHTEGMLYVDKTRALLNGWRRLWGYDFPYYFVQIAPYQYGKEASEILPIFWEAQSEITKTIPKTGMAVISDCTTLNNIHPPNKEVPGSRLALLALANDYGKNLVSTGPVFKSLEQQGNQLKVNFESAYGLTTRDGSNPDWFEVAGKEGEFNKASAVIQQNAIYLQSKNVTEPQAVRFAWDKLATPNLMNAAGLPATAFRAGDLSQINNPAIKTVPEAADFRMIYQIDIPSHANYSKTAPEYHIDNSTKEIGPFTKIAYYLELEKTDGTKQYIFTSMNRFTDDLTKIGIPINTSGARFMQKISKLTVQSNVAGVENCTNSSGGNIEFWPGNYSAANQQNIPGASNQYDFGDAKNDRILGYGCMQIHNWKAKQTAFSINHWGNEGIVDIGIGNAPKGNKDWTFSKNASEYTKRRLSVMVK